MIRIIFIIIFMYSNYTFAEKTKYPAFELISPDFQEMGKNEYIVKNMPPVRNQGFFSFCYGYTAWTLYMQYFCKNSGSNCQIIDPKNSPSPIALSANGAGKKNSLIEGGGLYQALSFNVAQNEFYLNPDDLARESRGSYKDKILKVNRLKLDYYDPYKKQKNICLDCFKSEINSIFNISRSSDEVLKLLDKSRKFDDFIYDVILSDTSEIDPNEYVFSNVDFATILYAFNVKNNDIKDINIIKYSIKTWPDKVFNDFESKEKNNKDYSYTEFLDKIKPLLKNNIPVGVSLCLFKSSKDDCDNSRHNLVISGYKKFCNKNDKCIDAIKVVNSWGDEWEIKNNDGWVDAKNLYLYLDKTPESFVWLEKR